MWGKNMKIIKLIENYSKIPETVEEIKEFNEFYDFEEARMKHEDEMQTLDDPEYFYSAYDTQNGVIMASGRDSDSIIDVAWGILDYHRMGNDKFPIPLGERNDILTCKEDVKVINKVFKKLNVIEMIQFMELSDFQVIRHKTSFKSADMDYEEGKSDGYCDPDYNFLEFENKKYVFNGDKN